MKENRLAIKIFQVNLEEFPLAKAFGWKKFDDTEPLFIFPPRREYIDDKSDFCRVERHSLQSINPAELHSPAAEYAKNRYDPHVERYGHRKEASNG